MNKIVEIAKKAKIASANLLELKTRDKNTILLSIIEKLDKQREVILKANKKDIHNAQGKITSSLIDRLTLDNNKIDSILRSLKELIKLNDYIGEIVCNKKLKSGPTLTEVRVPFGVVGVVYESRPNVTIDVCAICLKSSSAVILKGGSEALHTNKALVKMLTEACPVKDAFQLIESTDRGETKKLLTLHEYVDLIIPRGSEQLIAFVRDNATVPIIETGRGNCHIFLDEEFHVDKALKILLNAKTQRPSACNAAEKLLIHSNVPDELVRTIAKALKGKGIEIRGCKKTSKITNCVKATEDDWKAEYLDLVIAIKIVKNIDEAIIHINKYGSKHSEAIISDNKANIKKFQTGIDAAVVYANASTRFTDGYEFGLGAEIGISTQKLHARGPMGLKALTTTKYLVQGNGQIRH